MPGAVVDDVIVKGEIETSPLAVTVQGAWAGTGDRAVEVQRSLAVVAASGRCSSSAPVHGGADGADVLGDSRGGEMATARSSGGGRTSAWSSCGQSVSPYEVSGSSGRQAVSLGGGAAQSVEEELASMELRTSKIAQGLHKATL